MIMMTLVCVVPASADTRVHTCSCRFDDSHLRNDNRRLIDSRCCAYSRSLDGGHHPNRGHLWIGPDRYNKVGPRRGISGDHTGVRFLFSKLYS